MRSHSMCECECDKSCDCGEYLDYVNVKCRKRLIDKLVEKHDEDIDGNEISYDATLYDYGLNRKVCRSCTWCIILLIIEFILIIMGISGMCVCFYWHVKRNYVSVVSY